MKSDRINKILIDPDVEDLPLTQHVLENKGEILVEKVHPCAIQDVVSSLTEGKRLLWITRHPGGSVKPCPATSSPYLCCQYTVIHHTCQCPMDCTYCVLQGYLESPLITIHVNVRESLRQADAMLESQPFRFFRFGR